MPEILSDEGHLVSLARQGDQEAFGQLSERYSRALEGILFAIVRDRERARDLTQDTILRAWEHLSKYEDSYKFSTWLFRIGSNLAISYLRRLKIEARYREEAGWSEVDQTSPLEGVLLGEDQVRLRSALSALPDRYREVMRLRYVEELPVQEIAAQLDTTPNTISIILFRAKRRLKEDLELP